MNDRPILGLTLGDPAGIGPELCLRALQERAVTNACVPVIFGDAVVLDRLRAEGLEVPEVRVVSPEGWRQLSTTNEPLLVNCRAVDTNELMPGQVSAACGAAAYRYIELAIQSALEERISGVVTAPIHKEALKLAGVKHPGHTEIFTTLTGAKRSCMMLSSDVLTVTMVTTHIGYGEVPQRLSTERILDVIELTHAAVQWMQNRTPRLAICGLNPHAGEHGLFGEREEERYVQPAIQQAHERGIVIDGPLPPDAAFTTGMRKRYDAIVTLYHDQGHIPFKMLAFDTGVNITLGLPIIRTSVDHGTAFDIAWRGIANPESLFAAIHSACKLAVGRRREAAPV